MSHLALSYIPLSSLFLPPPPNPPNYTVAKTRETPLTYHCPVAAAGYSVLDSFFVVTEDPFHIEYKPTRQYYMVR